jgi:hypothetical protein
LRNCAAEYVRTLSWHIESLSGDRIIHTVNSVPFHIFSARVPSTV